MKLPLLLDRQPSSPQPAHRPKHAVYITKLTGPLSLLYTAAYKQPLPLQHICSSAAVHRLHVRIHKLLLTALLPRSVLWSCCIYYSCCCCCCSPRCCPLHQLRLQWRLCQAHRGQVAVGSSVSRGVQSCCCCTLTGCFGLLCCLPLRCCTARLKVLCCCCLQLRLQYTSCVCVVRYGSSDVS